MEEKLTKKEKRCRKCIKWNDKCGDYEMSRLNNGAPVKSCSNYYPISKYNSPYEVERRARRQKFINSVMSNKRLSYQQKMHKIHVVIEMFNLI